MSRVTDPTAWDASAYHRVGTPMARWAEVLLDELSLRGDEVVLDAGCGSGVVTESLARRLPRGRVYALDASSQMVERLGEHLAAAGLGQVTPLHGDLATTAPRAPCDVLFSNAVFHWIEDFDAAAAALGRWARAGARLRAQCGGPGNLAAVHAAAAVAAARTQALVSAPLPAAPQVWFRSAEAMATSLTAAGFRQVEAWDQEEPTPLGDRATTTRYLGTVILRLEVAALPEALRGVYLDAVYDAYVERHGEPFVADYRRLNLRAVFGGPRGEGDGR